MPLMRDMTLLRFMRNRPMMRIIRFIGFLRPGGGPPQNRTLESPPPE